MDGWIETLLVSMLSLSGYTRSIQRNQFASVKMKRGEKEK
jgi:hypothetical protein